MKSAADFSRDAYRQKMCRWSKWKNLRLTCASRFEGFMDFLSTVTLGLETGDCLVLNSVANVEKAMRYCWTVTSA